MVKQIEVYRAVKLNLLSGKLVMGKQISFFIEYDLAVMLAEKAIEYGCKIIINDAVNGIVTESDTTDIISEKFGVYYFHVPEAGKYGVIESGDRKTIDAGYNKSGITLIEFTPTVFCNEEKELHRGRLFCISDYYDEEGRVIKRPDCVTKVYNALSRYVKKIAPYTEVEHYVFNTMYSGKKFTTKKYISKECLSLVEENDYALG